MAVGGIDHDHVALGVEQSLGPLEALVLHRRCSRDPQPASFVLGGVGEGDGLFDILDGDEADAAECVVDHQQFLDTALMQQAPRLVAAGAELVTVARSSLVISSRTGCCRIVGETHVAIGQDAHQLAARFDNGNLADPCGFSSAPAPPPSVAIGAMVMGLTTIPLSKRLTARTAAHCSSTERLRCSTPMPPICAITIAMSASVTVSIAEEMTGMLRLMFPRQAGARVGLRGNDVALARPQEDVVEGKAGFDFHGCHQILRGAIRGGPCNRTMWHSLVGRTE